MPEETLREIILSIAGDDCTDITPNYNLRRRASNLNGSKDSIVGCYLPMTGHKRLFKRKRSLVLDDFRRRTSIRKIQGTHPKISEFQASESQPVRRSSLKIQADKVIQKVRKSFSMSAKSYQGFNESKSKMALAPYPDYLNIDFISACLLNL